MVYNPNLPLLGLGTTTGFGGFSTRGTPAYNAPAPAATTDPYAGWLNSPIGQKWNEAQESAARQARRVADEEIAAKKRQLDLQVRQLEQQGRFEEARLKLQQGEAQLARERFAVETEIQRAQLALQQEDRGLQRAQTYAQYASTPDRLFMLGDLEDALGRVGQGLNPQPYGSTGTPTPKTYADFEAIAGPSQASGGGMRGSGQMTAEGRVAPVGPSGEAPAPDPRVKAAKGVLDAIGFNDDDGIDASTEAALAAVQNIASAKRPGILNRLSQGQKQGLAGGASRLGYYAPDFMNRLDNLNIRQGNPRAA